jgi:hypothetical protein
MNNIKKSLLLIGLGGINVLHSLLHIVQFIQSLLLINNHSECSHDEGFFNSPYFVILWAIVGVLTLVMGIKDFIHHRKCDH